MAPSPLSRPRITPPNSVTSLVGRWGLQSASARRNEIEQGPGDRSAHLSSPASC
jgi:hypothetical protein